jgi:hypothetical protein
LSLRTSLVRPTAVVSVYDRAFVAETRPQRASVRATGDRGFGVAPTGLSWANEFIVRATEFRLCAPCKGVTIYSSDDRSDDEDDRNLHFRNAGEFA